MTAQPIPTQTVSPVPTVPSETVNLPVLSFRMTQMEKQNAELNSKVDNVQKDVNALRDSITTEFAALKKTLFERPLFVTFELLKVELESRDRAITSLQADKDKDINDLKDRLTTTSSNTISTARHYTTIAATVLCVFIAPFVSDYLGRLS